MINDIDTIFQNTFTALKVALLSFASAKESSKEKQSRFRCGELPPLNISSAEIGDWVLNFIEHFRLSNIPGGMKRLCCVLYAAWVTQIDYESVLCRRIGLHPSIVVRGAPAPHFSPAQNGIFLRKQQAKNAAPAVSSTINRNI
jgi:hypothetical protein